MLQLYPTETTHDINKTAAVPLPRLITLKPQR
jgi:hypothetical protein